MDVAFVAVVLVHVAVWVFVLFAWVQPRAALLNLTVVIPLIYMLHLLPFHLLTTAKQRMHPDTWRQDNDAVENALVIPALYDKVYEAFEHSFANPLSPQGMLVLGALTSAWRLVL